MKIVKFGQRRLFACFGDGIVCRGKVREVFYDAEGNKTAEFVLEDGCMLLKE